MSRRTLCLLVSTLLLMTLTGAQAQFFEYLHPVRSPNLRALSGDGNSVVAAITTSAGREPAVWSVMDGWVQLFPGAWGSANGISRDGRVVVGALGDGAFLWRAGHAPVHFPSPSSAWALDDSGTRFILWRNYAALRDIATDTDIKVWPSSDTGYTYTITPSRISRDGSTVIGSVSGRGRTETGFVERIGGVYFPLPRYAVPQAVSADGSLVAGAIWDGVLSRYEAFMWSESTGVTILPRLPVTPQTQGQTAPIIGGIWRGTDGGIRVAGAWRVPHDDPESGWWASEGEAYAAVIWTDTTQPPQYLRHFVQRLNPVGEPNIPALGLVIDVSADGNVMMGNSGVRAWRAVLVTTPAHTPVPQLSNISPATVPSGSETFWLRVEGRGFRPNAQVRWDGSALRARYLSPTQMEAEVPSSLLTSPGTAKVAVFNPYVPGPEGNRSNELTFTVGGAVSPELSLMYPTGVREGSTGVTLRVQGKHFTPASQVEFGGTRLTTRFVSAGELRADLPDTLLSAPATYTVRVYEPSLSNYSNSRQFVVTTAMPSITRLTPNSTPQGSSADVSIRITGSGFGSGTIAYFNWNPIPTTYVSSTELRATVPGNLISSAGTYYVSVYNSRSGWFSNTVSFRVTAVMLPPPGAAPGVSPSPRISSAHIVPNVVSQVFVTIKNEGGGALTGARVTAATLSGLPTVLLPDPSFSELEPGGSVQLIFSFLTPNIQSGQSFVFRVTGTSDQGNWSLSRVVTVP